MEKEIDIKTRELQHRQLMLYTLIAFFLSFLKLLAFFLPAIYFPADIRQQLQVGPWNATYLQWLCGDYLTQSGGAGSLFIPLYSAILDPLFLFVLLILFVTVFPYGIRERVTKTGICVLYGTIVILDVISFFLCGVFFPGVIGMGGPAYFSFLTSSSTYRFLPGGGTYLFYFSFLLFQVPFFRVFQIQDRGAIHHKKPIRIGRIIKKR